jgi:YHS domain-containing protein
VAKNKIGMRIFTLAISFIIILASCKNNKPAGAKFISPAFAKDTSAAKFTLGMVNNKIDLSCGMPLSYGIKDTCHYNGKVFGFCSKECKDEFVKNPKGAIREK